MTGIDSDWWQLLSSVISSRHSTDFQIKSTFFGKQESLCNNASLSRPAWKPWLNRKDTKPNVTKQFTMTKAQQKTQITSSQNN